MRRTTSRIAITTAMALGLTALGTTARAQPRLSIPEGVTTDRASADPWAASLDFGLSNFGGNDAISYAARVDMYGQLLADLGAHRAGGYVMLPYARVEGEGDADAVSKIGHLELGGLFTTAAGATTDAVLRAGFAVELSEEEEETFDSLVLVLTGFGRLSDVVIGALNTNWARLSGSLLHRSHPYFARADLGLDVPFSDGDDDPYFRLNLAGGVDLESVALLGELANLATFTDSDDDEILSTFAFTLRIPAGTFSPVLSVVIPLDEEIQDLVDFVFVIGVRAAGGNGT